MRLQEAPCQHDMSVDPSVAKEPTRYMDIGDTLTFYVSASYIGPSRVFFFVVRFPMIHVFLYYYDYLYNFEDIIMDKCTQKVFH